MHRFSRDLFVGLDETGRDRLARELAAQLTKELQGAADFHEKVRELVEGLRGVGHELWSFDEADEMEVWAGDYTALPRAGIVVTFRPEAVEVAWSEPKPN
jgi:hypothetical protein